MAAKKLFEALEEKRSREFMPCAHEMCPHGAWMNVKTKTGNANFCRDHYFANHKERARIRNEARGIFTRDDAIAYCRAYLPSLGVKMPPVTERIPGSDDE